MVAIDTNVVVRFLTKDNATQFQKAKKVFEKNKIFIPDSVILETEWVLRYAYNFGRQEICDAFTGLLGLQMVNLSSPHSIFLAIEWHRKGMDFSDALHLASSRQHSKLYTFDEKFVTKSRGLSSFDVTKP